jgi:hypothetical protein
VGYYGGYDNSDSTASIMALGKLGAQQRRAIWFYLTSGWYSSMQVYDYQIASTV